jgi:DMSO reductase anchor subunit
MDGLVEVNHRSSIIDFLGLECGEIKLSFRPMSIPLIRLLFDFGLLVLIWLVQLVIYPSFLYYEQDSLKRWHEKYTQKITYVVLPLMMGQLIITTIHLFNNFSTFTFGSFLMIITLWMMTFLIFVPLHSKISNNEINLSIVHQLIRLNWIRTLLWSGLFVSSLLYYLTH